MWERSGSWVLAAMCALGVACGDDAGGGATKDAGGTDAATGPVGSECSYDGDCDDGVYCDGVERCERGFCVEGSAVQCDDGIACTTDRCSHATNGCLFEAGDVDGDGHADATCTGPDDEALGDDCDDADPDRYPGNVERCDLTDPAHDEDCDGDSFGTLDQDSDGFVDARCCAPSPDGQTCGADCDDANPARFPDHPEICDDIDNDCDDQVDVGTKEVPWYVDADDDGYGASGGDSVMSCAPVSGRSLRATDCDDAAAAVHPAAREVCDQLDNDCDEAGDEDGVCDCAPSGAKQACACDATNTGSQLCVDGSWSACDCTECVSGVQDCLGDLLPRECVNGLWVVHPACSGARPICLSGQCVCVDGTTSCAEVEDVVAPSVFGLGPTDDAEHVSVAAVVSAVFTEQVKASSVTTQSFYLQDGYGRAVPATLAVGTSTITLDPTTPLLPGMGYTAHLTTGITDLAGNAMLSGRQWSFMTTSNVMVDQMAPPANVIYDEATLAINASGNALLVLDEAVDPSGPRVSATARISGSWLTPTVLTNASGPYHDNVAMDDANGGFTMLNTGATSSIFTFDGTTWTSTAPYGINVGNQLDPPAAVEGSGFGLAVAKNPSTSTLGQRSRSQGGIFAIAAYSGDEAYTVDARADVGPGGYGAISWINTNQDAVELWHTAAGLTGWVRATAYSFPAGGINANELAVNASGLVLQVWAEEALGVAGEGWHQRIAARFIAADNTQVGSVDELLPWVSGAPPADPRADFDASGNALVVFRDQERIYARRFVPGTGWSALEQLSLEDSFGFGKIRLAVSANGSAVVAWSQEFWLDPGSLKELWVARFTPATGWAAPQRISAALASVIFYDAAIDASGNSLVVWKEDAYGGLQMASP